MVKDFSRVRDYYNARYSKLGDKAFRPAEAYSVFLKYLGVNPGEKILDVGCGNGFLLMEAERLGLEIHGIDISPVALELAKKNAPKTKLTVGEAESLDYPDQYFDKVTCIGSLEHCLDMGKALQEMRRVVKGSGRLCLVVPNKNYIFWKLQFGRVGTEQQEIKETLLDYRGWRNLLEINQFQILGVFQDRWFASNTRILATKKPWGILYRALYKLAWLLIPLRWTYQFVFICSKSPRGT